MGVLIFESLFIDIKAGYEQLNSVLGNAVVLIAHKNIVISVW